MQIIKNGVAWLLALLEFVNHLELMAENKKKIENNDWMFL